jgi:FMN phosphatase YigB (HAD superfamily)
MIVPPADFMPAGRRTARITTVIADLDHTRRVRVVAYTESPPWAAYERLRQLGLSEAFDRVWCVRGWEGASDTGVALRPAGRTRRAPAALAVVTGWIKGSVQALEDLCAAERTEPASACVVGDHLGKDVRPAQDPGAAAIWARYGTVRTAGDDRLARLCSWDAGAHRAAADPAVAVPHAIDRFDQLDGVVERLEAAPSRGVASW